MNTKKTDTNNNFNVSETETDVAFSGPALISNRFYVSLVSTGVRISFTEQGVPGTLPKFRTAVGLSHQDAISLYKLLQSVLKDIEPIVEKAEKEAAKKQ